MCNSFKVQKNILLIQTFEQMSVFEFCFNVLHKCGHTNTHFSGLNSDQDEGSVSEIAFDDPVDVDDDFIPHAEFEAFVSNSCASSDIGKLFLNYFCIMSVYFIILMGP